MKKLTIVLFILFAFVCVSNATELNWDAYVQSPNAIADGFKVYQSDDGQTFYSIAVITDITATSYIIDDADYVGGHTYSFYLTAYNVTEESLPSNTVIWTPGAAPGVINPPGGLIIIEPDPEPLPIIYMDNDDSGTTAIGSWNTSSAEGSYGTASVFSKYANSSYTFVVPVDNNVQYDISVYWTAFSNRRTNVPIVVYDGDTLLETVTVNQMINAGQFNIIGTYQFTSGIAKIVYDVIPDAALTTSVDAVRFVPIEIE